MPIFRKKKLKQAKHFLKKRKEVFKQMLIAEDKLRCPKCLEELTVLENKGNPDIILTKCDNNKCDLYKVTIYK